MCYGVARYKPEWHLQNHFFSVTWQHRTVNSVGKKTIAYGEYCPLPFLEAQYPNEGYIFCPDLVRAHHARATIQCLKRERIPFFKKEGNSSKYPSNPAHRRHVGHYQAARLHRGLDNCQRDILSAVHWGAVNLLNSSDQLIPCVCGCHAFGKFYDVFHFVRISSAHPLLFNQAL